MNYQVRYWDTDFLGFVRGRNLRNSAIHPRVESDAVCGQSMGYERPLYLRSSAAEEDFIPRSGFGAKAWEISRTYDGGMHM